MPLSRRDFCTAASASVASAALGGRADGASTDRPNIVCIMADDLGFSDIGCYGSEIRTPNLDRMARGGMRFTQFYNAARCCPSRACLLTGLDNHQAGVGDMVNHREIPEYQGYLNDRCVTVAEALRTAGYRTAMAGKWHVGENRPHWPVDRGFEKYFGLISGASSYWEVSPGRHFALNGQEWRPDGPFYATDAYTDHAVDYVNRFGHGSSPFFLYLAYTAPHWPLHAPSEDIARYRGKYRKGWDQLRLERHARQLESGLLKKSWPLTPRDEQVPAWDSLTEAQRDEMDLRMSVYAAQIDRMDQGIGRVLDAIKQAGQEQNTLVLFLADNGGCHEEKIAGERPDLAPGPKGSFTSYGRPWANASNTPFRLFKHWVHEGGISAPFIAYWPGAISAANGRAGTMHHQPAHITDLMPTFIDLAKAQYPKTYKSRDILPLEGLSLVPTFQGKARKLRPQICWEHEGNRAIRKGQYKLVSGWEKRTWELYDIDADRSEMNDLARSKPEIADSLRTAYEAWAKRVGVTPWENIPKPNTRS